MILFSRAYGCVQVQPSGLIETYFRSGLYPTQLPAAVGPETTGMIVALSADPATLNHPEYRTRCYVTGANVIAVHIA